MPRIYRVHEMVKNISYIDPYFISTLFAIDEINVGTVADVQKASEKYTFPTPATTSRKLRHLAEMGLVSEEKKGKRIRYRITDKGRELADIFRNTLKIQ
ncbi:MAG: ArsR/SmtB family transcription factor [Candidatus Njordarchaeia archaeon]